jgi:hypothetical protein
LSGGRKEARGKVSEENHLRRFRNNYSEFPAGKLTLSDHPDFLLETSDGVIGIEHTRYIRGNLGADEHAESKALWLASQAYEHKGYPPDEVHALWSFHEKPTKHTVPQFVDNMSEFVARHLPNPGDEDTIQYPHWAWKQMPQEIISLTISRRRSMEKNFWVSNRGGFVPELGPADFEEIIRKKEGKVSSYQQNCSQVWLFIVANGFEPSTHCSLAREIEGFQFDTKFDRVFFLHYFDGFVVELSTKGKKSEQD